VAHDETKVSILEGNNRFWPYVHRFALNFIKNKQSHKIWRFEFGQGCMRDKRKGRGAGGRSWRKSRKANSSWQQCNGFSWYWISETGTVAETHSACSV
jgi:hypothetical protein